MPRTFVFRLDGAPDNDAYLQLARSKGHVVYAGIAMTLERGWIPDFVEVVAGDDGSCAITLVELEATTTAALIGARKYLPEPSETIRTAFLAYLERVLERCRASADPRIADFQHLSHVLKSAPAIVYTAAALRRPPEIVEKLSLIDQGGSSGRPSLIPAKDEEQVGHLHGVVSLSPRLHKTVARSILLLDAVVRGWDKSDASLRAWRNLRSQPLRREIQEHKDDFPALASILLGVKLGARLGINDAARELSEIWNRFHPGIHSETSVLASLNAFLPLDGSLDPSAPVQDAFKQARAVLGAHAA